MRATLYFIVEVKDSYNNYKETKKGVKLMVNNTIDSVEHINRVGTIIDSPKGTLAKKGDEVIFHHNICRKSYGVQGTKDLSPFQIKPNVYFVPATEIFMIKRPNEKEWSAIDPFVFIKPLKAERVELNNGLSVIVNNYGEMNESVGEVHFVNKFLEKQGLKRGDIVSFEEYSQHEYIIDGELYYKMMTNDILATY